MAEEEAPAMAEEEEAPAAAVEPATVPADGDEAPMEVDWSDAHEWLASLPKGRNVSEEEIDDWLVSNGEILGADILSVPREVVYENLKNQHKIIRGDESQGDNPVPRFKQSDKWKPVWGWLESLDEDTPVGQKEIAEWLNQNPRVEFELESCQSRRNLVKYIQKCYYIVMKKKKKQRQELAREERRENSGKRGRTDPDLSYTEETPKKPTKHARTSRMEWSKPVSDTTGILAFPADDDEDNHLWTMDKEVVKRRYELLCQLQVKLRDLILKAREQRRAGNGSLDGRRTSSLKLTKRRKSRTSWSRRASASSDSEQSNGPPVTNETTVEPSVNVWACSHASTDEYDMQSCKGSSTLKLVWDREAGLNSGCGSRDIGPRRRKWTAAFQGWWSLERRFKAPGVKLGQRYFSSWMPTWSAYSSSVALAQPAQEGLQKVLDVRFHPCGSPQIVCGCNAAPNELLIYNLITGKSKALSGHNCQVQAVEYASQGSLVVSCAESTVKVWDSSTAECLYTLGPGSDENNVAGHKKKISAMAVNPSQSCLVATSGGQGDRQLLLWNVVRGTLVSELISQDREDLPPMDALEFCNNNLLICGSDSSQNGSGLVQIWDVDALLECCRFRANDMYITCLKTNPAGTVMVTGSGDGTIGLFDIRSCGAISRLPLGPRCEVTSVSYSSCGRYIQASCTANRAIVWDTRLMPMEPRDPCVSSPLAVATPGSRVTKALHCLSHGKPMPTAENTCQRAGFVDAGDQGVNDARWFNSSPVLVTASGDGSVALWDVTLGEPCLRHLQSHSRCVNTVSISSDDDFFCTGGDDQKLVLYENVSFSSHRNWRLTHPLL
ncbi:uncharacterized protein LOC9632838 isoform X1 [Selaginella moellendorffii]|uniref:uncharacterized protein LOC9632838 isoform X1 n=1 Tax=Selaginella moellendorffii TaxID=88036 RepID=UPI000D1D025F|nr:uncharacterized protein LOC9632838 isoform X1 [Selaginella moellendorffii]|eukprot:XP_024528267.1 uncharacterized protein LOC9632838 isoform X1 [Selaginella moellendorffii]